MPYLETLEKWASTNRPGLEEKGIAIVFVRCDSSEKPAAYIDVDTSLTLARVTAWSSGEIQMEALAAGSGRQLIIEAHKAENSQQMIDLIEGFVERIT